jgi:hypothetical protein
LAYITNKTSIATPSICSNGGRDRSVSWTVLGAGRCRRRNLNDLKWLEALKRLAEQATWWLRIFVPT